MQELRFLCTLDCSTLTIPCGNSNGHEVFMVAGVDELNQPIPLVVTKSPSGLRVIRNKCEHKGGMFLRDIEDSVNKCVITCGHHGWKLDLCSLQYTNPAGVKQQHELVIEDVPNCDILRLHELSPIEPWHPLREPLEIPEGEFKMTFFSHACVELQCGNAIMFTDPWLIGPAFSPGWWLAFKTPQDAILRLSRASLIYISHQHSDHLSIPTLSALAKLNPDIPIVLGDFESRSIDSEIAISGMKNLVRLPFGTWHPFGDDARIMILRDAIFGDIDSCCIVDYKGHLVVNTVDCNRPNGEILPNTHVDILLTDFAGGSSSFPHCWAELYSEAKIRELNEASATKLRLKCVALAKIVRPKVYVPFAGYFVPALDPDVHARMVQNTPDQVVKQVVRSLPRIRGWCPKVGGIIDIPSGHILAEGSTVLADATDWNFDVYLRPLRDTVLDLEGVRAYVDWAFNGPTDGRRHFRDNLVVHIIETSEDFAVSLREYFIDLSDGSLVFSRPSRVHQYKRLRVRAMVIRNIMIHHTCWEALDIGYQARFYREPDNYNLRFWMHVKNLSLSC